MDAFDLILLVVAVTGVVCAGVSAVMGFVLPPREHRDSMVRRFDD